MCWRGNWVRLPGYVICQSAPFSAPPFLTLSNQIQSGGCPFCCIWYFLVPMEWEGLWLLGNYCLGPIWGGGRGFSGPWSPKKGKKRPKIRCPPPNLKMENFIKPRHLKKCQFCLQENVYIYLEHICKKIIVSQHHIKGVTIFSPQVSFSMIFFFFSWCQIIQIYLCHTFHTFFIFRKYCWGSCVKITKNWKNSFIIKKDWNRNYLFWTHFVSRHHRLLSGYWDVHDPVVLGGVRAIQGLHFLVKKGILLL